MKKFKIFEIWVTYKKTRHFNKITKVNGFMAAINCARNHPSDGKSEE